MQKFATTLYLACFLAFIPGFSLSLSAQSDSAFHRRLEKVTVTGKKPQFEQKTDRMVINVRSSITSAGGTALEVLGKSSGVTIDRQSNTIAINGKNGVVLLINGKISYMPADAVLSFLDGIPAGNIEKIELITTPPSKYEAAGNAGLINIVLINNPYAGLNGSYFLTAGYGLREVGGGGLNFNYRNDRLNIYGNYSLTHDHNIQLESALVDYVKGENLISNLSFSHRDANRQVYNMRMGVDYQLDTATTIGILVSGYVSRWKMIARNGATVSRNNLPDTIIRSVDDPEMNLWQNIMGNLNLQHSFRPGTVLYFDLNYLYYKDHNPNTYSTDYYDKANAFLYHEDLRSSKRTPIQFKVISTDYTTPLGKKIILEAGGKLSLSQFTNEVGEDRMKQGSWTPDTSRSERHLLKENIGAAYASFTVSLNNKIIITAGLRYEYSSSNLGSRKVAQLMNRKYGEFFPTFTLSKKFDKDRSFNFTYSRRITRPTFNDLAPFTVFFDPKTFFSGNPGLQPAIANALQASFVYKNYSFTLSYTDEAHTIDNFYFQTDRIDTVNNLLYLSSRNFSYTRYLTASFSLPWALTNKWSMQNNLNGNWQQIGTSVGNKPVTLRNFYVNLSTTQRWMLPADLSLELTGLFSSGALFGTEKRKSVYQVDLGVQKKFGGKDLLRLAANDIFNSGSDYRMTEALPVGASITRDFDFQLVSYKLTYTHNFGNNALKAKRVRSTGAEDELKRVQ